MEESGQDSGTVFEETIRETVNTESQPTVEDVTFVQDLFKKVLNLQATAESYIPEGRWLAICMAVLVSTIIIFFLYKLVSKRRRPDKRKQKQQRKESTSDGKKKV